MIPTMHLPAFDTQGVGMHYKPIPGEGFVRVDASSM